MTFQDTKINYTISGKGPAVVFLHGFLESSTMWETLIPDISLKHSTICIDLPGHGKTGVLAEIHSMELMAETVQFVLKNLNIKTATFVGHSMGGYVALAYLELFPSNMEKLILLNSTPQADSEERKSNRNRTIKLLSSHPRSYINMAISNLMTAESREKFPKEIEKLKMEANLFPVEGLKASVRGMRDRKDRTEILKNFKGNKIMVLSKEDPILPLEETRNIANYSKTDITEIDGGHMSLIESNETIALFLKKQCN